MRTAEAVVAAMAADFARELSMEEQTQTKCSCVLYCKLFFIVRTTQDLSKTYFAFEEVPFLPLALVPLASL